MAGKPSTKEVLPARAPRERKDPHEGLRERGAHVSSNEEGDEVPNAPQSIARARGIPSLSTAETRGACFTPLSRHTYDLAACKNFYRHGGWLANDSHHI